MKIPFILLIGLVVGWCGMVTAYAQKQHSFNLRERFDEKTLQRSFPQSVIQAFDLSPDGSTTALLVGSINRTSGSMWIATIGPSQRLEKAVLEPAKSCPQGYAPSLTYASRGQDLIVADCASVKVYDAFSLAEIRTIVPDAGGFDVPLKVLIAGTSNIVALAFGSGAPIANYMDKHPVRIDIVDISTGKRLTTMNADDVPLSLSPDGKLLALTDHADVGEVLGISIVRVADGKQVLSTKGSFGFSKHAASTNPISRVLGNFVAGDELVLTSDGNRDQLGNTSGDFWEIVSAADGREIQRYSPTHFGLTGIIAVAANGSGRFVTISRDVSPKDLRRHSALPASAASEWIVCTTQPNPEVLDRGTMAGLVSLRVRDVFGVSSLRMSSDGSAFAVAEAYGVTIFAQR